MQLFMFSLEVVHVAADFNQPLQLAAVLLEKPCGINRTAPAGRKSEFLNTVLPQGGDQQFHILVPDNIVDVQEFVAILSGFVVLSPDARCGTAKAGNAFHKGFVFGSDAVLASIISGLILLFQLGFLW